MHSSNTAPVHHHVHDTENASLKSFKQAFIVDSDSMCLLELGHPTCPSTFDLELDLGEGSDDGSSAGSTSGHLDSTGSIISRDGVSEIRRQTEATTVDDNGDVEGSSTSNPKLDCDKQDEDMDKCPSPSQMCTGEENVAPANGHTFCGDNVVDAPPGFTGVGPDKDRHAIKLEQGLGPGRHDHQVSASDETQGPGWVEATTTHPNGHLVSNWLFASWACPEKSIAKATEVIQQARDLGVLRDPIIGSHSQSVESLLHWYGTKSVPTLRFFKAAVRKLIAAIGKLKIGMATKPTSSMHRVKPAAHYDTAEDKTSPTEACWKVYPSPSSAARQTRMNESNGVIHRLMPLGRTIHFDVDTDSFSRAGVSSNVTDHITHAAREVARGFRARNLGISFDYAPGPGPKVFSIRYDPGLANDTLAESFFPCDPRGRWRVRLSPIATLPRCFGGGLDYIHNILAHEFTHILGFRHWNAGSDAREVQESSVLWPGTVDEDRNTIMNTGAHVGTLCFSGEDFRVIRELYLAANGAVVRDGRVIMDVDPYGGRYV